MGVMPETMGPLGLAFAAYVRARAGALDLKQSEIADRIGMPRKTFGRYWHGERPVTIDQMEAIVRALGDDFERVRREELRPRIAGEK
jgi:transcriptional regulator with XRE-family HTH domain